MQMQFSQSKVLHLDFQAKEDHIQRASRRLQSLKAQNRRLIQQMEQGKKDPFSLIRSSQQKIINKMHQLKEQNARLSGMINQAKMPKFAEMSRRSELCDSLQKLQVATTCRNESVYNAVDLKSTLYENLNELRRQSDQLQSYLKSAANTIPSAPTNHNRQKLQRIAQYKKKLVAALNEIRDKQRDTNELVISYRRIYQQTLQKYKQQQEQLQSIVQIKISEDIDQRYARVLGLEQQLNIIQSQLRQLEDKSWLREIITELQNIVVERMGLSVPPCNGLREYIDQLCDVVMESYISSKRESNQRNQLIKQHLDQEKSNNIKTIMLLKNKEQILGKKLIQHQMKK